MKYLLFYMMPLVRWVLNLISHIIPARVKLIRLGLGIYFGM